MIGFIVFIIIWIVLYITAAVVYHKQPWSELKAVLQIGFLPILGSLLCLIAALIHKLLKDSNS